MRRPSITYEALLAALTLGAATSQVACSKGAVRSEPTPAAASPSQTPTPAATIVATPSAAEPPPVPAAAPRGEDKTESSSAVDAGRELNAPRPAATVGPTKHPRPTASAACGGSSCSPDMKKGN